MVQDWERPWRVLGYSDRSNDVSICLEARHSEVVLECAAASFAECKDYESHTAGVISLLCKGLLYVKSAKRELMSKSSMEAELIGISDMLPRVVWTRESLAEQGYKCGLARSFQVDHVSTAVLASKGSSVSKRTRHTAIKCYYVRDKIGSSEVVVERLPTEYMIVYAMTKTLQGILFRGLRSELMD